MYRRDMLKSCLASLAGWFAGLFGKRLRLQSWPSPTSRRGEQLETGQRIGIFTPIFSENGMEFLYTNANIFEFQANGDLKYLYSKMIFNDEEPRWARWELISIEEETAAHYVKRG